jgi:dual specificity protein kinase YAK1
MGHSVPRRLLTNPGEGVLNSGFDNAEANLIVRVSDVIMPEKSHSAVPVKYVVIDHLGQGTFGQVFHCDQIPEDGTGICPPRVAIKIVKNKPAYTAQAWVEIKVAKLLNTTYGENICAFYRRLALIIAVLCCLFRSRKCMQHCQNVRFFRV